VVTSDTAAAHVAGALGVPVWLALSRVCDWRWMQEREDTPWYPTMRLFRQRHQGDWDELFARMADPLRPLAAGRRCGASVTLAPGELLDKLTILQIKAERFTDAAKLHHVRAELAALQRARSELPPSEEVVGLTAGLKEVNVALWQVEDALRLCEKAGDFGPRFIEQARSIYRLNDQRSTMKRRINEALGSPFQEQKLYAGAEPPAAEAQQ
jgi:hypothetical protein